MCYSGCPYERKYGDNAGECAHPSKQGTPESHCYEPEADEEDIYDPAA